MVQLQVKAAILVGLLVRQSSAGEAVFLRNADLGLELDAG